MNIIIIDDDRLAALSLKTILEASGDINITAVGYSGAEAVELYDKYLPDILLMDIRMEGMSGLDAGKIIISEHPDAKILLLTTFSDDEYIIRAIRLGARGYILKQAFDTIAPALFAVYNGQTVFGDEIMGRIPTLIRKDNDIDYEDMGLNAKEFEIIRLVSDGLNNKEISSRLFLSEGTVRNYISTILEKLCLRDRTQLACFYYRHLT